MQDEERPFHLQKQKTMLPSNQQADMLREIFSEHIKAHDETLYKPWKGPVSATVPESLAPDMRQAMGFMGCAVDQETVLPDGHVVLFSRGCATTTSAPSSQ